MALVRYAGSVEQLQGEQFDVPDEVIRAGQAAAWIESTSREKAAKEKAAAEAERRQQDLLNARLEKQRRAAEREAAPAAQQDAAKLSESVLAAGAAIVGKAELIDEQCRNWASRHEAMVAGAETVLADAREQTDVAVATTEASREQLAAELASAREQINELERDLTTRILSQVGPQGEQGERGLAGSGLGYVDANPQQIDQKSLGRRFFGRDVVPGDLLLQRTADELLVWRTADGRAWEQVDSIINKQEVRDVKVSALDASVKSTTHVVNQLAGSGGGGGLEKLVTTRSNSTNFVTLGDSSNWSAAGFQDPRSGHLWLEVLDPNTAESGTLSCVFEAGVVAGNTRLTVYALAGPVFDRGTVMLELDAVRLGAPIIPATLAAQGITAAPGAGGATQLKLRLWDTLTNPVFLYRGGVGWLFKSDETVRLTTDPTPLSDQPLWIWG